MAPLSCYDLYHLLYRYHRFSASKALSLLAAMFGLLAAPGCQVGQDSKQSSKRESTPTDIVSHEDLARHLEHAGHALRSPGEQLNRTLCYFGDLHEGGNSAKEESAAAYSAVGNFSEVLCPGAAAFIGTFSPEARKVVSGICVAAEWASKLGPAASYLGGILSRVNGDTNECDVEQVAAAIQEVGSDLVVKTTENSGVQILGNSDSNDSSPFREVGESNAGLFASQPSSLSGCGDTSHAVDELRVSQTVPEPSNDVRPPFTLELYTPRALPEDPQADDISAAIEELSSHTIARFFEGSTSSYFGLIVDQQQLDTLLAEVSDGAAKGLEEHQERLDSTHALAIVALPTVGGREVAFDDSQAWVSSDGQVSDLMLSYAVKIPDDNTCAVSQDLQVSLAVGLVDLTQFDSDAIENHRFEPDAQTVECD